MVTVLYCKSTGFLGHAFKHAPLNQLAFRLCITIPGHALQKLPDPRHILFHKYKSKTMIKINTRKQCQQTTGCIQRLISRGGLRPRHYGHVPWALGLENRVLDLASHSLSDRRWGVSIGQLMRHLLSQMFQQHINSAT